jgi:SHS2 domain-containing protein
MYKPIEHTADYQIEAAGKNLAELFSDALAGMMTFLKNAPPAAKQSIMRKISLRSENETLLLIEFLSEALRLAQVNKEIYCEVKFNKLDVRSLKAELIGIPVDGFDDEIKAVTYHGAEVKSGKNGKLAVAILFDI